MVLYRLSVKWVMPRSDSAANRILNGVVIPETMVIRHQNQL